LRTIIINNQRIRLKFAAIVSSPLILLGTAAFAAHSYAIDVSDDLSTMTVEARFDRPINSITARSQDAGKYLRDAEDCDSGKQINARSRRLGLPDSGIQCLRYTVDLSRAASAERLSPLLDDRNIVVSPT